MTEGVFARESATAGKLFSNIPHVDDLSDAGYHHRRWGSLSVDHGVLYLCYFEGKYVGF